MRFGIIGTANIARDALLPAIRASEHTVAAVASRSAERAAATARAFDVPASYGSYDAMLADDTLDAVYVPLPNGLHGEWTRRAADADLHVLCEKPLAADLAEAREVVGHCRDRGVVLAEAFMYRYHPRTERAFAVADRLEGVHTVEASFSFRLGDPEDVRLDPALAGGALMDVGCYPVSFARGVLGEPDRAYAVTADSRDAGVDTRLSGLLGYDDAVARVHGSFDSPEHQRYRVEAENGWLEARPAFNVRADEAAVLRYAVDGERHEERFDPVDQYRLHVEAFATAVADGHEPRTGPSEALGNARAIEALYESAASGSPEPVPSPGADPERG
jgi:predicted dehydrogenase